MDREAIMNPGSFEMEIPPSHLQNTTLRNIVIEFILREGTDYGLREWSIDEKVDQVINQINQKKAVIVFDLTSDSFSIKLVHDRA